MKDSDIYVEEIAFHRNGVSGNGFVLIKFKFKEEGIKKPITMLGTLFEEDGNCAVIQIDNIERQGIKFLDNSWRGDYFESTLRKKIEEHNKWMNT